MTSAAQSLDATPDEPAETGQAERLRQLLDEQNDVLALVEHELRNPLHAMSMQLALAQRIAETQGQPEIAARVGKAQATLVGYLERLTVMLQLVRLRSGAYPLRLQAVDLSVLLHAVLASQTANAEFRQVRLEPDLPASCMVHSDPLVIEQLVENLVLNAIKHSGCSRVRLALRRASDAVQIEVLDDGHGIAAEDQERVFGKFGVAAHTPRGSGTGLGLWIVRKLAAALGGDIALQSRPGQGCVFTVNFPLPHDDRETTP